MDILITWLLATLTSFGVVEIEVQATGPTSGEPVIALPADPGAEEGDDDANAGPPPGRPFKDWFDGDIYNGF